MFAPIPTPIPAVIKPQAILAFLLTATEITIRGKPAMCLMKPGRTGERAPLTPIPLTPALTTVRRPAPMTAPRIPPPGHAILAIATLAGLVKTEPA